MTEDPADPGEGEPGADETEDGVAEPEDVDSSGGPSGTDWSPIGYGPR